MPINSKAKGNRGERELASKLREHGFDCKRGQQFCAANGDPDVVGLPGIWPEIKRVEKLNISTAMAQAVRDAKSPDKPAVFHRKNNEGWLVTLRLDDFMEIYKEWFQ